MYTADLKEHLKHLVNSQTIKTFDDVFEKSMGAFPEIVYSEIIKNNIGLHLQPSRKHSKNNNINNPEPNPTNFDWRFDKITVKKLVNIIKKKQFKRIALFGTPSLFTPIKSLISDVTLYDVNNLLEEKFNFDERVIITDLNSYEFKKIKPFDCVIIDPPWYIQYYKIWLQKASSVLSNNGDIYISLFQPLLRPKSKLEISAILDLASKIGNIKVIRNFIRYSTPTFEKELFKYKQIPCNTDWRMADLMTIKKTSKGNLSKSSNYIPDEWRRILIENQTIAIKKGKKFQRPIKVDYPYKKGDDFIKSVSNRDQIRHKLNFITSRNKGLIIAGNNKIIRILTSISKGVASEKAIGKAKLTSAEKLAFQKIINTIYG